MSAVDIFGRWTFSKKLWEEKIKTIEGVDELNCLIYDVTKEASLIADEHHFSNISLEKCKQAATIYGIILRGNNPKYKKFIELWKRLSGGSVDCLLRPTGETGYTDWIKLHEWYFMREMKNGLL